MTATRPFRTYLIGPVLGWLRRGGTDVGAVLRSCSLPRDAESAPWVELSLDRLHAFFESAARAGGDELLGARVGGDLSRSTWDVLQVSCMSSPDLRHGLRRLARLMPLMNDQVELEVREEQGTVTLEHRIAGEPLGLSRQGNELLLAALLSRVRAATGVQLRPAACWLAHPAPRSEAALRELLGTPALSFGSGATGVRFDATDADRPLRTADPVLLGVLDRLTEPSLAVLGGRRGTASAVLRVLAAELDGEVPDIAAVARRLATSTRALQRALHDEATSFRALVEQVRQMRARDLLASGLSIEEIAARLGYSETSGFTRAFARWTGSRPRRAAGPG